MINFGWPIIEKHTKTARADGTGRWQELGYRIQGRGGVWHIMNLENDKKGITNVNLSMKSSLQDVSQVQKRGSDDSKFECAIVVRLGSSAIPGSG